MVQEKPNLYDFDHGGLEEYKYATHFTISSSNREFFLDFTCARPDAKPRSIARIIITEMAAQELLLILNQQLQLFRKRKQDGGEGEQEPPTRR